MYTQADTRHKKTIDTDRSETQKDVCVSVHADANVTFYWPLWFVCPDGCSKVIAVQLKKTS